MFYFKTNFKLLIFNFTTNKFIVLFFSGNESLELPIIKESNTLSSAGSDLPTENPSESFTRSDTSEISTEPLSDSTVKSSESVETPEPCSTPVQTPRKNMPPNRPVSGCPEPVRISTEERPLVQPYEVTISQRAVLTAEPVLTPLGK